MGLSGHLAVIWCIVLCHCFLPSLPPECFMAPSSVTKSYFPGIYGHWPDPPHLFSQTGQGGRFIRRLCLLPHGGRIGSLANKAEDPNTPTHTDSPSWTQSWNVKGPLVGFGVRSAGTGPGGLTPGPPLLFSMGMRAPSFWAEPADVLRSELRSPSLVTGASLSSQPPSGLLLQLVDSQQSISA